MTEQERIDRQFENWFAQQPSRGNAGQGWPLDIWWKDNSGDWQSTFEEGIGNAFHIGSGTTARLSSFPNVDGVSRDEIIIAPFMLLSYRVKGVKKDMLYAYPAVEEVHEEGAPAIRYPLQKFRVYFFWRYAAAEQPEWNIIEDYRKEAFLNIVKPPRDLGDFIETTTGKQDVQRPWNTIYNEVLQGARGIARSATGEEILMWGSILIGFAFVIGATIGALIKGK